MENRSDILFLYDATMTNPNGDPLDDNKPRIVGDQEIVTDVRLKRTIRDFIIRNQEKDDFLIKRKAKVWLVDEKDEDGNQKTKDKLLEEKKDYWNYTDIRLFGATILSKGKERGNEVFTGPVQFRIGVSLNKVNPIFIKGTTVSPSGKERKQGTFTERWVVEYALISFYGVFNPNISNENASLKKELEVKKEDLETLYYSIWNGTKDLVSQSK
ncbi:MAG: CRISPR-associated protein, partial [Caldisphaera sp.]